MLEKYRISGIYLKADMINGVYQLDYIDLLETEVLKPLDFLNMLYSLDENDSIVSFFNGDNEHIFDIIEKEYKVNYL